MVLWAAPCPVFVVPFERELARTVPISAQTPRWDVRLPDPTEGASELALLSPTAWHPIGGGDAA